MRTVYLPTALLAILIALIAKDPTGPLVAIAAFGLFDRMIMNRPSRGGKHSTIDPARS